MMGKNKKYAIVEAILLMILQYCTSSIGLFAIVNRLRGKDFVLVDFYRAFLLGIMVSVVLSIDIYRKNKIPLFKQDREKN